MAVLPLNSSALISAAPQLNSSLQLGSDTTTSNAMVNFTDFLSSALAEVDQAQKISDQMSVGLLLGSVDIHQATIAMDKASLTLRTFVQVRDKMLEAYQEVMRMQI